MLSKEENELLTRVGPGTPAGEMLRRYWWPIAATVDLDDAMLGYTRGFTIQLILLPLGLAAVALRLRRPPAEPAPDSTPPG